MKNGYEIVWTDHALEELEKTIAYLEENWTDSALRNFARKLEALVRLISQNPYLFQVSDFNKGIRNVVVLSHNTLYYRIINDRVEIISFFSNRQNPQKLNLK